VNSKEDRIEKDMEDRQDEEEYLPFSVLTRDILGCSFAVMKELGPGFLVPNLKSFHECLRSDFGADCDYKKPDIHGYVGGFFVIAICGKR
jgi:hypothetical protein